MDGRDLTTDMLRYGYLAGAFPMGDEFGDIEWYSVTERALFPITGIHVSRSLQKTIRSGRFRWTFDQAFNEVMHGCLRPGDNWITSEIIRVFTEAHVEGWGHSVEVWSGDELVGGSYGLAIGGAFFAESMFHRQTDASKVAVWALINECRSQGFEIFDAQVMNPHLASLGAYNVPEDEYEEMLERAVRKKTQWGLPVYRS